MNDCQECQRLDRVIGNLRQELEEARKDAAANANTALETSHGLRTRAEAAERTNKMMVPVVAAAQAYQEKFSEVAEAAKIAVVSTTAKCGQETYISWCCLIEAVLKFNRNIARNENV